MRKVHASQSAKLLSTIILISFLTSACAGGKPPSMEENQGVPVKLQSVGTSTIEDSSSFPGNLEAQRKVTLKPETEGRITQVLVKSGDRVAVGTPIVELRLDRSKARVGAAVANVNAAKAARENARAQLKSAEAEQVSAAADVELQKQDFERISTLVSQGALERQRLDQVKRDRNAAIANLNAAQQRVEAARASLDQANAALSQSQAEVEVVSEDLQENKVVAPIAGIVGDIPVKIGDYVSPSDTLTTITQNQILELEISVPTQQADQLRVGLPVELINTQDEKPLATGSISFVSPQANSTTQTILAKASFANPDESLRDEQYVQARVIWQERPGVLVPTAAISRLGGQTFVFVAETPEQSEANKEGETQQIARQKPVKLGEIQGNSYQVIEGLEPGEKIVVSGILNLSDGTPIAPESEKSSVPAQ
ncbi:MAG: efflux RND transporter periplasmic adaptor subunit [Coleofasciculaceae cyanobacterium]